MHFSQREYLIPWLKKKIEFCYSEMLKNEEFPAIKNENEVTLKIAYEYNLNIIQKEK